MSEFLEFKSVESKEKNHDILSLNLTFVRSFMPRRAQMMRRYEYYIPENVLRREPTKEIFEMIEGRKSFHNFTSRKRELENKIEDLLNGLFLFM